MKTSTKNKLLFVAVLLTSCGLEPGPCSSESRKDLVPQCEPVKHVVVSDLMSLQYDKLTQRAVEYWNGNLGYEALVYDGMVDTLPYHHSSAEFIIITGVDAKTLAEWDTKGRVGRERSYFLDGCQTGSSVILKQPTDGYSVEFAYFALAHELGHAIGLRHSNFCSDVMYGHPVDPSFDLMPDTIEDIYSLFEHRSKP